VGRKIIEWVDHVPGWRSACPCSTGQPSCPSIRPPAHTPSCSSTHLGRIQQRLCHAVRHQAAHQDVRPVAGQGQPGQRGQPGQGQNKYVIAIFLAKIRPAVKRQHVQLGFVLNLSHRG
jgi:hypothetical protein